MDHLTASKMKYLIAIYEMDKDQRGVRSVEIAKKLNITRSSVHTMVTRLSEDGYLEKEHYGIVYMTEKGREVGKSLLSESV